MISSCFTVRLAGLCVVAGLCATSTLAQAATPAAPTVLSFDDIGSAGSVPATYGGLDWSASSWLVFDVEQAPYTPHSGAWRATLDFGSGNAASAIRFITPSVFDGAWFAGYADASVTFQLYRNDQLVATSATLSPGLTPSFLGSGYAGLVDMVVVASPFHSYYAMDDFTFEAAPVPEPSVAVLLLAGLCTLGALKRRRS